MGLDLQPDGLTAGLAGHCQLDKNILSLRKKSFKVTMGLDLQPDGLTAGLAGHCQLDKYPYSQKCFVHLEKGEKHVWKPPP